MAMRSTLVVAGAGAVLAAAIVALAQERTVAEPGGHAGGGYVDQRAPIALSDDEGAFIRREMRGLLESVRDILDASAAGDRARLVQAARRAGMNGPEADHIPKSIGPKLPAEFKKLGLVTHRAFDQIALEVEQAGTTDRVPKQLSELMGNCLACHATWRLTGEQSR